jgi:hypothetical protein
MTISTLPVLFGMSLSVDLSMQKLEVKQVRYPLGIPGCFCNFFDFEPEEPPLFSLLADQKGGSKLKPSVRVVHATYFVVKFDDESH